MTESYGDDDVRLVHAQIKGYRHDADAVLAALSAAGRLLPSGGEEEWAVRRDHATGTHWVSEPFYRREHAEALLAAMNGGGDLMYVVSRRIQAGPWQSTVVSDNSEVPNESEKQ